MYQDNAWTITAEGSVGNIEDQSSGKVLGLLNDGKDMGTLIILESKKRSLCSEGQKWLRDMNDENGWFRLKNPLSGKVLGLMNDGKDMGTLVVLESKKRSLCSEGQKWLRDMNDENGWFRLKNPLSGKVLTAQTTSTIALTGKKPKIII